MSYNPRFTPTVLSDSVLAPPAKPQCLSGATVRTVHHQHRNKGKGWGLMYSRAADIEAMSIQAYLSTFETVGD